MKWGIIRVRTEADDACPNLPLSDGELRRGQVWEKD
jgi:hypothetical protein